MKVNPDVPIKSIVTSRATGDVLHLSAKEIKNEKKSGGLGLKQHHRNLSSSLRTFVSTMYTFTHTRGQEPGSHNLESVVLPNYVEVLSSIIV